MFVKYNKIFILAVLVWVGLMGSAVQAAGTTDFRLDNGLRVILIENHRAPVASMLVWIKAGSAVEGPSEYGLAHFMEHMVFKGTAQRGPGELAAAVEASGGRINAYTSYDETVYYIDMAGRFVERGLDILADMVFNPSMDPKQIALEKEVVLEEIKMGEDDPGRQLSRALFAEAYRVHPYGRPIIGFESTVRAFTREGIMDFHRRWYTPENMILVLAGDFETDRIRPVIEEFFGQGAPAAPAVRDLPAEPPQTGIRVKVLRSDVQTAGVMLAFHIPGFSSPEIKAVDLLADIMGDGRTSRLYRRIKREQELVNSVSTWSYTPEDPGLFMVSARLIPEKVQPAIEALVKDTLGLSVKEAAPEELSRSKLGVQADFIRSRATMSGEARLAASFQALAGDFRAKDRYLADLEKVSAEDIKTAATEYLRPENLTLVVQLPKAAAPDLDESRLREIIEQGIVEARHAPPADTGGEVLNYRLKNGARLLVKADKSIPLVSIRAAFLGGLRYEDDRNNGLNNLMAEIWDRGTTRLSAGELARAVEDMAAEISSFSGRNSFGLEAEFLAQRLDPGLELFAEVLTRPAFSPEEAAKARPNILADIKRQDDQSASRAFRLFTQAIYAGHPYSREVLGTPRTVRALTAKDIRAFYDKWARPSNLVIGVVGDVDPEAIRARLDDLLGSWTGAPLHSPLVQPVIRPPESWHGLKKINETIDRAQVHLVLGFPAPGLASPDRYALEVLDAVLSGMGGRMFTVLRDERSLAYSVNSFYSPGLGAGSFGVYIAFDPAKLEQVQAGLKEVLAALKDSPVSSEELNGAKEYTLGTFEIGLQSYDVQAADLAFNELYGLGYDYRDRYLEGINAVTAADIQRVADKYLNFDRAVEVTVGPVGAGR